MTNRDQKSEVGGQKSEKAEGKRQKSGKLVGQTSDIRLPASEAIMDVPIFDLQGQELTRLQLDQQLWSGPVNLRLLSQAVAMYRTNLRAGLAFEEEIRLNTFYIENWSLWLDIKILFKSFYLLFFAPTPRGDY